MTARRAAAAIVAVVVTVGVAGILLWQGSREDAKDAPRPSQRVAEGQAVARALRGLASDPESLVAATSRHLVDGRARRAVPRGARVQPDAGSWRPDGFDGGVMDVTVTPPGRAGVRYAAVMVHEPSGWKVLATVVAERSTGPR